MVSTITIELIEKTKEERQKVNEAHNDVEKHYKEMENGQVPAINTFEFELEELVKSAQELLKKARPILRKGEEER